MTAEEYSEIVKFHKKELEEKIRIKTQNDIEEFNHKTGLKINNVDYSIIYQEMDSGALIELGYKITVLTEIG